MKYFVKKKVVDLEERKCVICLEDIDIYDLDFECKYHTAVHPFHYTCINKWAENRDTLFPPCPTCRNVLKLTRKSKRFMKIDEENNKQELNRKSKIIAKRNIKELNCI